MLRDQQTERSHANHKVAYKANKQTTKRANLP